MIIAVDGMGGDLAPQEIVKGAQEAANKETEIRLVGQADILNEELAKYPKNPYLSVVHASQQIDMDEDPARAVRQKKDASIVVAAKLVGQGQADALISAGSTGAQLAASIFYIGRIKGVKRPAIGLFYPTKKGMRLLVDAGANPDASAKLLEDFALMGSVYARRALSMENPKVGLISNGSEDTKGSEVTKEAFQALKANPKLNFVGNIEGKDIPQGQTDVMVCDGFTGNVILKLSEGLSETLFFKIKEMISTSFRRKIGALLLKSGFKSLKKSLDSTEYGGAPLLGVKGVSMICHGSSNARAIYSAVQAAKREVSAGYVEEIEALFKA